MTAHAQRSRPQATRVSALRWPAGTNGAEAGWGTPSRRTEILPRVFPCFRGSYRGKAHLPRGGTSAGKPESCPMLGSLRRQGHPSLPPSPPAPGPPRALQHQRPPPRPVLLQRARRRTGRARRRTTPRWAVAMPRPVKGSSPVPTAAHTRQLPPGSAPTACTHWTQNFGLVPMAHAGFWHGAFRPVRCSCDWLRRPYAGHPS